MIIQAILFLRSVAFVVVVVCMRVVCACCVCVCVCMRVRACMCIALDKMLRTNLVGAKREFRWWQRRVKKAVDKARVDWILKVATEAQEAAQDGKTRWECIRKSQQAYTGHRPCIPSAVRKEDGELTRGPTEVLQRWHQHFSRLFGLTE